MSDFKITTLNDTPHLFNKTIEMLENSFNYSSENSVLVDFAPLFDSENFDKNFILHNEVRDTVHGHIGYRKKVLLIKGIEVPISIIGGISISKEYQGKGHLKPLFQKVIDECSIHSTFILLWSDKANLYKKFDFIEVGITAQTGNKNFSSSSVKDWEEYKLKDLTTIETEQVKTLYNSFGNECCQVERDDLHWEYLKKIYSATFYIHRDIKRDIDMYFVINKGQDLNNIIHEFGYAKGMKNNLIKTLSQFKLWIPNSLYNKDASQYVYTSMMRAGNIELLKEFIFHWSDGDISILSGDSEELIFTFEDEDFELETEKFLQYVWGPEKVKEFTTYFKPLFISGLDSI